MFRRLMKALRYLFTGVVPAEEAPSPSATPKSSALILRDHVSTPSGKQVVEVRSDGIHVLSNDGQAERVIGLQDAASLNQVDESIRLHLTQKLALLLPEVPSSTKSELLQHILDVMSLLAKDQAGRVRQIIAEELGAFYNAPAELVKKLAWDDVYEVASPILEFSPLLSDRDLLDIIQGSTLPGVPEAISRRSTVSEDVADALVHHVTEGHIDERGERIISNLLDNPQANLSENALVTIAEHSEDHEIWHAPLLSRPALTIRTVNTIARFVSHSLIADMESRRMLSKEMAENLSKSVTHRLQNPHYDREREAEKEALNLYTQGLLDAEYIAESLELGEKELVTAALGLLTGLPKETVKKILGADDAKAATALVWKAGIPMRTAIQVQLKLAKIHYTKILYAKNGQDYPLTEEEMLRILSGYAAGVAV
ncbi:MAG: DUF2336 domain-containing protein [Alphaproteobacteria bacterium]|nr:DUF2336 domain-containing protein [Alphaproteobacteria bacterium]